MNSKEKKGYVEEINYQNKMIKNLTKWLRNLFVISSLALLMIYYFSNNLFVVIAGTIITLLTVIGCIFIGKAIYSGRKNINILINRLDSERVSA